MSKYTNREYLTEIEKIYDVCILWNVSKTNIFDVYSVKQSNPIRLFSLEGNINNDEDLKSLTQKIINLHKKGVI